MMGWDWDWGWGWFMWIFMMLVPLAVLGLMAFLAFKLSGSGRNDDHRYRARGILAERFATGEISATEYKEMLKEIDRT